MKIKVYKNILFLLLIIVSTYGCKKLTPLPSDTIDPEATFTRNVFNPTMGRNYLFTQIFNYGNSSTPLEFEIVGMKRFDGTPAPEITDSIYAVKVWKNKDNDGYTGFEKSIEEIENKRTIENHRIFEMRKLSGDVAVWSGMNVEKMILRPDSGYRFDVKVSNSGSTRYYYNFRFMPGRPELYAPNIWDENNGMLAGVALPSSVSGVRLSNIVRAKDNVEMTANDVDVYFVKRPESPANAPNTLSFVFMDSVFRPINPDMFSNTDWPNLVHGFNMKKTSTEVTYDVAYPIPLVEAPTKYTNPTGNRANVNFSYYRVGAGNTGVTANMAFSFAIWQKGNWEIRFVFKNTSPKFAPENG